MTEPVDLTSLNPAGAPKWTPPPKPLYDSVPADVEIVEYVRTQKELDGLNKHGVIRPNAVLINGEPLQIPKGSPVTIAPVELNAPSSDGLAKVTFTMFVRSASIRAALSPNYEGTPTE